MRKFKHWEIITIPAVLAAVIALWYAVVSIFSLPKYVLPVPLDVGSVLVRQITSGSIWRNLLISLGEAGLGFTLGLGIALALGIPIALAPLVRRTLLPIVMGWQSFPHLILAPLIVVWFGFGQTSKIVLAAIMSFFPMFVAIIDGLSNSPQRQIEMIRVFGGSAWDVFLRVRLRNALGYFFTGVNLSVIYALLGAVVGEWVGASAGLGFVMVQANARMQTDTVFAAMALLNLVLGGLAVVWLGHVNEDTREIANKWLPSVQALGDMRATANRLRASEIGAAPGWRSTTSA